MLGVGPLLGYFFGTWLDKRLGSAPWLQFIFLGLGFAAAVRYIVQTIRRVQKDLDRM
jgi:F0F1-type ATP synthase assembly protein I